MRACLIGGTAAAGVLAEAAYVGSVNGGTLIVALAAWVLAAGAVWCWRAEGRKMDRLVAAALHPNRQADRDDQIIRVANAAQVRL
ncbi:hypothetical protein [Dactylosporangium salmoneum]|uniref:Uncharacterized protein n=1 Tax=Dactylosporangium salmoneum TaxID=53361 RepID=A0ABP5T6Y6_9ACTN